MYFDEILVYLMVAGITGWVVAMVIRGWNRPFFRSFQKTPKALDSQYLAPIWGFRCSRKIR